MQVQEWWTCAPPPWFFLYNEANTRRGNQQSRESEKEWKEWPGANDVAEALGQCDGVQMYKSKLAQLIFAYIAIS